MLEAIKGSLRIKHNSLDGVIQKEINTCLLDLKRVGVNPGTEPDDLVGSAVELYCKWKHDFMGKGADFERSYKSLRDALSLSEKYRENEDEG